MITTIATMTARTNRSKSLVRLLQLASPTLPVGAYSYSQGLEAAIETGIVSDAASAEQWIGDVMEFAMARMEAPVLFRLIQNPSEVEALKCLRARSAPATPSRAAAGLVAAVASDKSGRLNSPATASGRQIRQRLHPGP